MGKNKKVFVEAVSEMKHFLLGAALVLALVTVVPALAQMGPSSGGGSMPSGGGMAQPSSGGSIPSGGGMTQPSSGGSMPSGGGMTQPSSGGSMPSGGGMAQPSFGGSMPSVGGTSSTFQGGFKLPDTCPDGKGKPPFCVQDKIPASGGFGMKNSQGNTYQPSSGGQGMNFQGQGNNFKQSQFKKPVQKKLDAAKFTKIYDKGLKAVQKQQTALNTALTKAAKDTTGRKALTAVKSAAKKLGKLCSYTMIPNLPVELDIDEFDCESYLGDALDAIVESLNAKDAETAVENITIVYTDLADSITQTKQAVEDAINSANEEQEDEDDMDLEEELDMGF